MRTFQRTLKEKKLNAGVLEDKKLQYPEDGTPQGGVISPLLSNVYQHCVLDMWFEKEVVYLLKSQTRLIWFADDFATENRTFICIANPQFEEPMR